VQRKVAIKVIKPGMDSHQVIARFEAERQALSLMDHPNIAKVLDAGTTDSGRPYFVMELVNGVPITQYCDAHHLTTRQRLELLLPVCQAIQHAHQKGIIHRDIKPSNILVAEYDQRPVPKVIDFGVAKAISQTLTEKSMFTGLGQIVGTLEYMSPEQAKINQLDIDTRSDVYSLGVLLYELLTGSTPLDKTRLQSAAWDEMLRIIREEDPPKPSTRLSDLGNPHALGEQPIEPGTRSVPATLASIAALRQTEPAKLTKLIRGELDWIVMKAIEKDRNRRYETASFLAMDLQRYLADEPVMACPPSARYRLRRFARRNKVALTMITTIAAIMVLGTLVSTWQAIRATKAEVLAEERLRAESIALGAADASRLQAVRERNVARHRLFDSRLAEARASRLSRAVGQRFGSLKALGEAVELLPELGLGPDTMLELRNDAIVAMTLADLRVAGDSWEVPSGPPQSLAFDSMLERYAYSENKCDIRVCEVGGRELIRLPPVSGKWSSWTLQFSPNDQFIAAIYLLGERRLLRVWDWNRSEVMFDVENTRDWPGFSLDSRQLAIGHEDGSIRIWNMESRTEVRRFSPGVPPAIVKFHPREQKIAVAGATTVHILNSEMGEVVARLPSTGASSIRALAWHPRGRHLATAAGGLISIWDTESGADRPRLILDGPQSTVTQVAFDHCGDILASNGYDAVLRLWNPWTGEQLLSKPGGGIPPKFSTDDRLINFQDGSRLSRMELVRPRECRLFGGDALPANVESGIAFTPDGRILAGATGDAVRLWDSTTSEELAVLPVKAVNSVLFDPRMKYLITSGNLGLNQWMIERHDDGGWQIGAPQTLSVPVGIGNSLGAMARDGRTLATRTSNGEGVVLNLDRPGERVPFRSHPNLWWIVLSPDGETVVTGPWNAPLVRVWNARTGEHKLDLPIDADRVFVNFSPDGKWLVTGSSREFRLWRTGSWEPGLRIPRATESTLPGFAAFAPGSSLLAITHSLRTVKLIDLNTSREVATLAPPNCEMLANLCFSPDGTSLAVGDRRRSVHVWNLRQIRAQLAAISLDWNAPSYEPVAESVLSTSIAVHVAADKLPEPTDVASDEVVKNYTRIIRLAGGQSTDPARIAELADTWKSLGQRQISIGRPSEASASFAQALALWQTLVDKNPSEPRYLRGLASVYGQISSLYGASPDPEEGVRIAQKGLAVWERLVQLNLDDVEAQADLMRAYGYVGNRLRDARQWDAARVHHEKKLALLQELINLHGMKKEFERDLGDTYNSIGDICRQDRQKPDWADRAITAYLNAQAVQDRLFQTYPKDKRLQSSFANTLYNLGQTYWHAQNYTAALPLLDRAIVLHDRLLRLNPSSLSDLSSLGAAHYLRGRVLAALGRNDEGLAAFQSCISNHERLVQLAPAVPGYRRELAQYLGEMNRLQKRLETSDNQKPQPPEVE
jgi:WD40 repeat protein/tetratricopeptide (TPR) repeat protein